MCHRRRRARVWSEGRTQLTSCHLSWGRLRDQTSESLGRKSTGQHFECGLYPVKYNNHRRVCYISLCFSSGAPHRRWHDCVRILEAVTCTVGVYERLIRGAGRHRGVSDGLGMYSVLIHPWPCYLLYPGDQEASGPSPLTCAAQSHDSSTLPHREGRHWGACSWRYGRMCVLYRGVWIAFQLIPRAESSKQH